MRAKKQGEEVAVEGKEVFVGIDVHKESWPVTVQVEEEELFHGRIVGEYRVLGGVLDRFASGKIKVAYEAGPCGFGLYDQLREDGVGAMVVPPPLIPVESRNKIKTDKRDSRKLAKLLASHLLKRVYVLAEEDRAERELLRISRQILEHRSDVAWQIKSKLFISRDSVSLLRQRKMEPGFYSPDQGTEVGEGVFEISFQSLITIYEYLTGPLRAVNRKVMELIPC